MGYRMMLRWCLLSTCAAAWLGCAPEEYDLASRRSAAGPGLDTQEAPSAGCALVKMLGGVRSGEISLATIPKGASTTYTLRDGTNDLTEGVYASLSGWEAPSTIGIVASLNEREVLRRTVNVRDGVQSVIHVYAHPAREPRVNVAEVDLSAAGPGLRRARFTNYIEAVRPIQLFLFDANDQRVGEVVTVAWGETWAGTIPSAAVGYREGNATATTPFNDPDSLDVIEPAALPCVDAFPIGQVFISTESPVSERYTYLPPLCA